MTFNPLTNLTLYANYGVLLSLGPQAPWWVDNASQFLAPFNTRQAEAGAKYEPTDRILLSTAFFHMRAPFFYPKILAGPDSFCDSGNPGDPCFESQGRETHDGVELNAQGKAANWLRLTASIAALRAVSQNTGTPAFDNKQVINVPQLRSTVLADLALPHVRGLYLMPGWSFTSRKEATRDDTVSVPAYNLFNLGLATHPAASRAASPSASMPATSPISNTGPTRAQVMAIRLYGSARRPGCGSRRTIRFEEQLSDGEHD